VSASSGGTGQMTRVAILVVTEGESVVYGRQLELGTRDFTSDSLDIHNSNVAYALEYRIFGAPLRQMRY
jgi:hypothetical protein